MELTPIGIGSQTFSDFVKFKFPYVDKTPLVYRLAHTGKMFFISRPRRFGKSLLVSTLKSYFEGDRASFQGTAMEELEQTWEVYPVLHLDLAGFTEKSGSELSTKLVSRLKQWEALYGITEPIDDLGVRFGAVIQAAHEKTSHQVVLLVDEYDKPLTNNLDNSARFEECRQLLRQVYSQIKPNDEHLRFVLLTGVSHFSKLSVFSDLNSLRDLTFLSEYSTLCGLTLKEIKANFADEVRMLARSKKLKLKECYSELASMYDGYLFAAGGERVYNPFSLLNCLAGKSFGSFWHGTGTPTFLVDELRKKHYDLKLDLTGDYSESALRTLDDFRQDPIPMLYQTGYLTIDTYKTLPLLYKLRFPNKEVIEGFLTLAASRYLCPVGVENEAWYRSNSQFVAEARGGQPAKFMRRLKSLFDERPYVLNVESVIERDVQNCFYIIFRLMGLYVDVEQTTNHGRIDITLQTPQHVYLFELKMDAPAQSAVQQIVDKGYANRFARDERDLFLVGIGFSSEAKTIGDYLIERREGDGYMAVPNEAEED